MRAETHVNSVVGQKQRRPIEVALRNEVSCAESYRSAKLLRARSHVQGVQAIEVAGRIRGAARAHGFLGFGNNVDGVRRWINDRCRCDADLRDRALFGTMYYFGLRASEVGLLLREYVNSRTRRIYIPRLKNGVPGEKVISRAGRMSEVLASVIRA